MHLFVDFRSSIIPRGRGHGNGGQILLSLFMLARRVGSEFTHSSHLSISSPLKCAPNCVDYINTIQAEAGFEVCVNNLNVNQRKHVSFLFVLVSFILLLSCLFFAFLFVLLFAHFLAEMYERWNNLLAI